MCGIAGLIYRQPESYKNLGSDLLRLIQPLETRGPDSCGVGLYGNPVPDGQVKLRFGAEVNFVWQALRQELAGLGRVLQFETTGQGGHAVLAGVDQSSLVEFKAVLARRLPQVHLVSSGQQLEIYKQVGAAKNLFHQHKLAQFSGSHGIGHTRMATESVVDTNHSHPFTPALDLALVHNGQMSNYYKLRFALERQGVVFETNNDSEAIAHYIDQQLRQGQSLKAALQQLLADIDGTYTLLVATRDEVGLVRDKFAAKPAVVYESSECIAIASEFRCLVNLPNFDPKATIWEPDAAEVNVWSTTTLPAQPLEFAEPLSQR